MNGYFQIDTTPQGTLLKLFPPVGAGAPCDLNEVKQYLMRMGIGFDNMAINVLANSGQQEGQIVINNQYYPPINETLILKLAGDHMTVAARFYPPSSTGQCLGEDDIVNYLNMNRVVHGIDRDAIKAFLNNREYCKDLIVARGTEPGLGQNAWVEYFFETDRKARPTLNEDGSVDFFHLNNINHVHKGDVLAVLHPEVQGTPGMTVLGESQAATVVKRGVLHYGRNIELSEDKLTIRSMVDGHVSLYDEKVFVSDVYEVEDVDASTGDIEYSGNVQINGNVRTNFSVKAGGDVIVKGVVEGAFIEAEGNITIAAGMNGMSRGTLKAGGNIVTKFIENATVTAGGYVETESILHSTVSAMTEVNVVGKKGFITGGRVSATNAVNVKTLGSDMGADTVIELGVDPSVKTRYQELKTSMVQLDKSIKQMRPVVEAARKKQESGLPILPEQMKHIKMLKEQLKEQEKMFDEQIKEMNELEELMEGDSGAHVTATGDVYAGTRITISGATMVVKETIRYCRLVKEGGDVRLRSL